MLTLVIKILIFCGEQTGVYACSRVPVHLGPPVCPVLRPQHWKGLVSDWWWLDLHVGMRITVTAEKLAAFLTQ